MNLLPVCEVYEDPQTSMGVVVILAVALALMGVVCLLILRQRLQTGRWPEELADKKSAANLRDLRWFVYWAFGMIWMELSKVYHMADKPIVSTHWKGLIYLAAMLVLCIKSMRQACSGVRSFLVLTGFTAIGFGCIFTPCYFWILPLFKGLSRTDTWYVGAFMWFIISLMLSLNGFVKGAMGTKAESLPAPQSVPS